MGSYSLITQTLDDFTLSTGNTSEVPYAQNSAGTLNAKI